MPRDFSSNSISGKIEAMGMPKKRQRTPRVIFGTEDGAFEFREKKKKKKKVAAAPPRSIWVVYERKVDALVQKCSSAKFFIDTYARDYETSGGQVKIRPEKEIADAKRRLAAAKKDMQALLVEIDSMYADLKWGSPADDDDQSVDVENVGCCKCKSFESSDDNDIVLCDRQGCFRAWHAECAETPTDEDDWFCPLCCCMVRCVDRINEEFGKDYDTDRWYTLFASDDEDDEEEDEDEDESGARQGGGGKGTIFDTELAESEDEDSDFQGEDDDEEDEDAGSVLSSQCSGDDPLALDRDARPNKVVVEDVSERNIIKHKRQRPAIDYVALNEAFVALEGYESADPDVDDAEWK